MSARTCKGAGGGIHACYWHPGLELHPLPSSLKSCNWKPPPVCDNVQTAHSSIRTTLPSPQQPPVCQVPCSFPTSPPLRYHTWLTSRNGLWGYGTLYPLTSLFYHLVTRALTCSHPCLPPPALQHSFVLGESTVGGSHTAYQPPPHRTTACPGASSPLHCLLSWVLHPHTILQALHLMLLSTCTQPPCVCPPS